MSETTINQNGETRKKRTPKDCVRTANRILSGFAAEMFPQSISKSPDAKKLVVMAIAKACKVPQARTSEVSFELATLYNDADFDRFLES